MNRFIPLPRKDIPARGVPPSSVELSIGETVVEEEGDASDRASECEREGRLTR